MGQRTGGDGRERDPRRVRWTHARSVMRLVDEVFASSIDILRAVIPREGSLYVKKAYQRELDDFLYLRSEIHCRLATASIWQEPESTPGSFTCPQAVGCQRLVQMVRCLGENSEENFQGPLDPDIIPE